MAQKDRSNRQRNFARIGLTCFALAMLVQQAGADIVRYELTFESTWNAENHPVDFPSGAHFSGTLGTTHNDAFSLWQPGELASPGIKEVAERGVSSPLDQEIAAALESGDAFRMFNLGGLQFDQSRNASFQVNSTHPLISFASMIAPSPDWLIGAHDVSLREDGLWIPEIVIDALPYDAGTDSGLTFNSSNLVTSPPQPIRLLTEPPVENTPPFGTYTLRLLSTPGDVNGSGEVDADDISFFCFRLGQTNEAVELSGDEMLSIDDVSVLVEQILGTRPGDANLDGEVGFEDFLVLSQNFGQGNGNWNRGDFNCDREMGFEDFLLLSENFGFSSAAAQSAAGQLAAVPEPTGQALLCISLLTIGFVFRKSGRAT